MAGQSRGQIGRAERTPVFAELVEMVVVRTIAQSTIKNMRLVTVLVVDCKRQKEWLKKMLKISWEPSLHIISNAGVQAPLGDAIIPHG